MSTQSPSGQPRDWREGLIQEYLEGLRIGSTDHILKLFKPGAVVHSPLYGKIKANVFYKSLFQDTAESRITLNDLYMGQGDPPRAAAYFIYRWRLKNGAAIRFDCVDLFEFSESTRRISRLRIIYDASEARAALPPDGAPPR